MATPEWSTACTDWDRRIIKGESLIPFDPLFPDEVAANMDVFNELRVVDVAGSPTMGELARPWVNDFVGHIFGSYNAETGQRLIKEFFLLISKKNTKSTTAAEIMLTVLVRNWRMSAEFLVLAPTVEIANNCFYPARDSIKADPMLSDLMHLQEHTRTIQHRLTGATLKVVAADNEAVSGKKATGILFDELWLFGKRSNAANMIKEATGGMASRPEGFTIYLTTQSDEPPAGVFASKLTYARGVRDGRIHDPQFLPVLYEFPDNMVESKEYLDPENFYITNPNLGASVDKDWLEREATKANEEGEESMRVFLAKHLNVEIGLNLRSDRWAGADHWENCAVKVMDLDELLARSEIITFGVDGGGLDDLLGAAAIGRCKETQNWLVWTRAWAHPVVLERRKKDETIFRDYEKDGDLVIVERIGQDVEEVAEIVQRIYDSGLLGKTGVDPHGLGGIYDELAAIVDEDDPEQEIVGVSQGWKLNGAIKTTERKLAEGTMEHSGSRLMNWCVGNARIVQVGNAISITKQASGFAKIDPLMAVFNAVTLMSLNPEARGKSFWETPAA